MSNESVNQMQQQFDNMIAAPMRTYTALMLDHFEQIANLQIEAMKTYTETGVQQARAALDIKDPTDVNAYIQNQQNAVREMGERLKGDADKVASMNQEFAEKARKVAEDNARNVSEAAQAGMNQAPGSAGKSTKSATKTTAQSQ